jgi:hypothetical protein
MSFGTLETTAQHIDSASDRLLCRPGQFLLRHFLRPRKSNESKCNRRSGRDSFPSTKTQFDRPRVVIRSRGGTVHLRFACDNATSREIPSITRPRSKKVFYSIRVRPPANRLARLPALRHVRDIFHMHGL